MCLCMCVCVLVCLCACVYVDEYVFARISQPCMTDIPNVGDMSS